MLSLRYILGALTLIFSSFFDILFFLILLPVGIFLRLSKSKNQERIFIGIQEISNNIHSISKCLAKSNYECEVVIINNKYYTATDLSNRYINITQLFNDGFFGRIATQVMLKYLLLLALIRCDTFLFIWNKTFMYLFLDILLIKLSGKKIVFMNCGDDVRYRPMQEKIDTLYGISIWYNEPANFFRLSKRFLFQFICQYMGRTISARDQATFQALPLFHFRFPQDLLSSGYKKHQHIPLILHCPSDQKVKRTDIVLQAIDNLIHEGLIFQFDLLENKPNSIVLDCLKRADIVIDQPGVWVGRLAVEAMASGCCVIGGNRSDYMGQNGSPVVQFDPNVESLTSSLRTLIVDSSLRQSIMNESYDFWLQEYSAEAFANYFQKVLDGTAPVFYPLPNQKELLLSANVSVWEKWFVKLFYHPSTRKTPCP